MNVDPLEQLAGQGKAAILECYEILGLVLRQSDPLEVHAAERHAVLIRMKLDAADHAARELDLYENRPGARASRSIGQASNGARQILRCTVLLIGALPLLDWWQANLLQQFEQQPGDAAEVLRPDVAIEGNAMRSLCHEAQ